MAVLKKHRGFRKTLTDRSKFFAQREESLIIYENRTGQVFFPFRAKQKKPIFSREQRAVRTLLIIIFSVLPLLVPASGIDSLRRELEKPIPDSTRLEVLNRLALEIRPAQPKEAETYALQAVLLARKAGGKNSVARASHTLATIYYLHAKYADALNYYLESIRIRESTGDSANLAKGYNNVALVYYELGNEGEALSYHLKSVSIKQRLNDQKGLASSYGNIGNIYYDMAGASAKKKRLKAADSLYSICRKYHENALKIQEQQLSRDTGNINLKAGTAATYNNIGNVCFEKALLQNNDPDLLAEALAWHLKAVSLQKPIEDDRGLSHSFINMAGIYEKQKKPVLAEEHYFKALSLLKTSEFREELKTIYEGLSQLYEGTGDTKKALAYHKLFVAQKDSIFNLEQSRQFRELQLKYDTEKTEREIDNKNNKLRIQNEQIEKSRLQERSLIIAVIFVSLVVVLIGVLLFVIWNRYQLKTQTSRKLQEQNTLIAFKNKEFTDSIRYASRIQQALLPSTEAILRQLPGAVVFFRPRDIVSGDFYWMEQWGGKTLVAAVDCTGHGVPGALMSMLGNNLLSQSVNVYGLNRPGPILNMINKGLAATLRKQHEEQTIRDGMDIALLAIDQKEMKIEFAGANNPLWLIRKGELTEFKGDKRPIGEYHGDAGAPFTNHEIPVQPGDMLYLFTDGYADQFGGREGKKFKYTRLKELLIGISALPVQEQEQRLEQALAEWQGGLDQVDDILVIGIRI